MKGVFRGYELDKINDCTVLPTNEQEKKDQWLIRYSMAAIHDLTEFMVLTWDLEVSADALTAVTNLGLPTWMPAMGGVDALQVKYNQDVTFDVKGEALSMDGTAIVAKEADPSNGILVENTDGDGTFIYTPNKDFIGTDSFSYTVTSSSGHVHTTVVSIDVWSIPQGSVEMIFANSFPNYSGIYYVSEQDV